MSETTPDEKQALEIALNRKDLNYILDDDNNVIPATITEWGKFRRTHRKIVKQEHVEKYFVSTVFVGIDQSFIDDELKVFETMVFPNESIQEEYCERYGTYKEAEEGHERAVQWVKDGMKEDE